MRRVPILIFVLFVMVVVSGCGEKKDVPEPIVESTVVESNGNLPNYVTTELPQDPNYIFAEGHGTSTDYQVAIDKASLAASVAIARAIEQKVMVLIKSFDEEVGTNADSKLLQMYSKAAEGIASQVINGAQEIRRKVAYIPGSNGNPGKYDAFVLFRMPKGEIQEALLKQIENNERMYTRFRATEGFKEMKKEVKEYEKYKEEQLKKMTPVRGE